MKSLRDKNGLTEQEFLSTYDPNQYEKLSVTVDILLFTIGEKKGLDIRKLPEKELRVLLMKRKEHPFLESWALPGGFVGMNEGLREAAYRKIKEETNVSNIYLEQLYTLGENQEEVVRDPRTRVISTSYMALLDESKLKSSAYPKAEETKWFSIKKIPTFSGKQGYTFIEIYELKLEAEDGTIKIGYQIKEVYETKTPYPIKKIYYERLEGYDEGLAFDHYKLIDRGLERLKNKIEYTALAFTLLPEYFTLSELQKVYEVILGKKLLKANFRRKIALMVKKTEMIQKGGHRPANYYQFNEKWQHEFME